MSELAALEAVTEAVESGAGLPEVVRAAARALDASLAVADAWGATLAVAARSPAEERALLSQGRGVTSTPLRVGDTVVGTLHMRSTAAGAAGGSGDEAGAGGDLAEAGEQGEDETEPSGPSEQMKRLLVMMIASEVERVRAPERASESAATELLRAILARELTDRDELVARAGELSLDIAEGASVIVARAHPQAPTDEGWRARVRAVAERGARGVLSRSIAALSERDGGTGAVGAEVLVLVPGGDDALAARAAEAVLREMQAGLAGYTFALGRSRIAADPAELPRAAGEALLAANVAEGSIDGSAGGGVSLAFEQTGAYRLLLSTMTDNPAELQRFYAETVEPLVAYDEQYETELVRTLATFLDADGNVAGTAQRLFTHRHTIYYRLERVRELSDLDVSSSDGREKLSLGLKAMRVLGISAAGGPASEAGAEGGRVPGRSGRRTR